MRLIPGGVRAALFNAVPGLSSHSVCPVGFLAVTLASFGRSRSIAALHVWSKQLANCSPCEAMGGVYARYNAVGLIAIYPTKLERGPSGPHWRFCLIRLEKCGPEARAPTSKRRCVCGG